MPYYEGFEQTGLYHLPPGTDVEVGDLVTGPGVYPGTTVTSKEIITATGGAWNGNSSSSTYIQIELSSLITTVENNENIYGITSHNHTNITGLFTGITYGGWSSTFSFSRFETITQENPHVYSNGSTVSFREDVKGWVSFKSFTPENAISCANQYYTFYNGGLWRHHADGEDMNNFYGIQYESSFTVVLNSMPSSVKSFRTLNYEGSQARVLENLDDGGDTYSDGEYYNLEEKAGWYVEEIETLTPGQAITGIGPFSAETNLEKGGVSEFIEKEGKWFGYFTGRDANITENGMVIGDFNSADFSVQGIGIVTSISQITIYGCTDSAMFNYDLSATADDGTCEPFILDCMDSSADNYNPDANTDSGACIYPGCTDPTAFNYDPAANTDDGYCIAVLSGCTDIDQFNYNAYANTDDGSCIAFVYGCTDSTQFNYNPLANTNDGTCTAVVLGCTASLAFNYNSSANTNDGSCIAFVYGCTDSSANNYDASANTDDGSCCVYGCIDITANNYNALATCDDSSCVYDVVIGCMDSNACNENELANQSDGSCVYCSDETAVNYDVNAVCAVTDGCLYCTAPNTLQFSSITQVSFLLSWTQLYPANDAYPLMSYSLYIDGVLNSVLNSANTTYWGTTEMEFQVNGLAPNTSYSISLVRSCAASSVSSELTGSVTTEAVVAVEGCTDSGGFGNSNPDGDWAACNYDPLANTPDGTCDYATCAGCTDPAYMEFCNICNDGGPYTVDNGTCQTLPVEGCTDSTAYNYDPSADTDDGSCVAVVLGCLDPTQFNNGNSAFINYGCSAANSTSTSQCYDGVNTDDGVSCVAAIDCPSLTLENILSPTPSLRQLVNVEDSTYSNANNNGYPASPIQVEVSISTIDGNGTTTIHQNSTNTDGWVINGNWSKLREVDASSYIVGQTSITQTATLTAGSCSITQTETLNIGCLDSNANNYDVSFDISDITQCVWQGCTDPTFALGDNIDRFASNYLVDPGGTLRDEQNIVMCNGGGGGNDCCTYNEPSVVFLAEMVSPSGSFPFCDEFSYNTVTIGYNTSNTAYHTADASDMRIDSDVGGANVGTITDTNLGPNHNLFTPDTAFIQKFGSDGFKIDQSMNLDYVNMRFRAELYATLDNNPSRSNQITYQFGDVGGNTGGVFMEHIATIGCRCNGGVGGIYGNYDSSANYMQEGSCIPITNGGCLNPAAINYGSVIPDEFTLTGTIDPTASTTVNGVNTLFLTEVSVGDEIIVSGETRTVASKTTNIELTVSTAFTDNLNDTAPVCIPKPNADCSGQYQDVYTTSDYGDVSCCYTECETPSISINESVYVVSTHLTLLFTPHISAYSYNYTLWINGVGSGGGSILKTDLAATGWVVDITSLTFVAGDTLTFAIRANCWNSVDANNLMTSSWSNEETITIKPS